MITDETKKKILEIDDLTNWALSFNQYFRPLLEGEEFFIFKYIPERNFGTYYQIMPKMDFEKNPFKKWVVEYKKFNSLRNICDYDFIVRYEDRQGILFNIESDMYKKDTLLNLKKKELKESVTNDAMLIHCNRDIDFRIKMYEKNCIFNNQLFYDAFSSGTGEPIKFTYEQLKNLLKCKQFASTTKIMGGSQDQRHNAINHLLKTQDLTSELFDLIFEKYKDDNQMKEDIIKFVLKSKKVDIKNIKDDVAGRVLLGDNAEELIKDLRKRISADDIQDDGLKLLFEII